MTSSWGYTYDFTEKSRLTMAGIYYGQCHYKPQSVEDRKKCLINNKNGFKIGCVQEKKFSETECDDIANNGLWAFCDNVPGFVGCPEFNLKLVLPTTTSAPFPIPHTLGGAAGGILLSIIVFVVIWFCRKKRNAMRSPAFANTKPIPTATGTGASSGFSTGTGTGTRNTGYV